MSGSRYIYGQDEALIGWAESRIPGFRARSDACAIGHARRDVIVGVVIYDTFSPGDCLIHLVSDGSRRWMTREFAFRAMAFPFLQCEFARVTCVISANNAESLRFTRHFGWTQEGVLRRAGAAGEDIVVFGMLREECRWLPTTSKTEVVPL